MSDRLIPLLFLALLGLVACQPPLKTSPRKVVTGLPATQYVAVLEPGAVVTINNGQRLAGIQVKDRGWSRDCEYPEVVERARNKALALGGNLLLIRQHKLPDQTGSSCSRLYAELYSVPSLEGLESQVRWHVSRPLLAGDLRGRSQAAGKTLPPVRCQLKYRLLGDYFNEVIVRTQTLFLTDSTGYNAEASQRTLLLRRAQLHFDLAELEARAFKRELVALAPSLSAITGQARGLLATHQAAAHDRATAFDTAWTASNYAERVLAEWESRAKAELAASSAQMEDMLVSLKKEDYRAKAN